MSDTYLGPLFEPRPRARRADPLSSHAAADELERSGRAEAQRRQVLAVLRRWPGSTSAELAALGGLDRHMVARRLPELYRAGYAERVSAGRACLRWWPRVPRQDEIRHPALSGGSR
jgi:hypothetical protein